MTEPTTPSEARRQGLKRARWIAAGAAVGSAVVLTGTIAVVHAAPSSSHANQLIRSDNGVGNDEYVPAQPFQPQTEQPQTQQQQPTQQQTPQVQPRTRSGGS